MKLDTHALAAEIAPKLVDLLRHNEARIVANAGGLLQRGALRAVFPILLSEIPVLTEVMITLVSERFGGVTLADVAASLVAIKQTARFDMGVPELGAQTGRGLTVIDRSEPLARKDVS